MLGAVTITSLAVDGWYVLAARAFDDDGVWSESAPVTITVGEVEVTEEPPRRAASST